MTSPRSFDGVGYRAPSFSSDTPIYDSLVAERGVPQIAPINVPPALPSPYEQQNYGGYGSGANLPASNLPALAAARPALGPGPSTAYMPAQAPVPQYAMPQAPQYGTPQPYVPVQRMPGMQPAPQQGMPGGVPPQPQPAAPGYGYPNGQALAPVAPVAPVRPMPQRPAPAPAQYGQQQYPPRAGY